MKILSVTFAILSLILTGCKESNTEQLSNTESVEKKELTENTTTQSPKIDEETKKFWQLVAQQNSKEAVNLANTLIKDNSGEVAEFYKNLFLQEGIKESVITRKEFNEVDFFFWVQAQLFQKISNDLRLNQENDDLVMSAYELVKSKIKDKGESQDISSYPLHIWNRGFGVCDRQTWVFCEIIYQLGGKTAVIYLRDPITKVSPHTICEINFKGKSYIVDLLYKKLLEGISFNELTPQKIKEVWSDHPKLHNCFDSAVLNINSMPIDYAERNQRLNARLGKIIKFGEPPQNRFHYWKTKYPNLDVRLWYYPIRLLKIMKTYQNAEK